MGDINCDGTINTKDILTLRKYLARIVSDMGRHADIYADGTINTKDLLLLRKYLAGQKVYFGKQYFDANDGEVGINFDTQIQDYHAYDNHPYVEEIKESDVHIKDSYLVYDYGERLTVLGFENDLLRYMYIIGDFTVTGKFTGVHDEMKKISGIISDYSKQGKSLDEIKNLTSDVKATYLLGATEDLSLLFYTLDNVLIYQYLDNHNNYEPYAYMAVYVDSEADGPDVNASFASTAHAKIMLYATNALRVKNGLKKLEYSDEAAVASMEHTKWMADNNSLSHYEDNDVTIADKLADMQPQIDEWGENICVNCADASSAVHMWYSSFEGNREYMLSPDFENMGCGFYFTNNAENGVYAYSTMFLFSTEK